MKEHKLSFGTILILKPNLAEVIIDEGIVMNEVMVDLYHDFLLSHLEAPFSLIINKKNSYTYTFEAQKIIASLPQIHSMAVLVGSSGALMSTETLIKINEASDWNIKLFRTRPEALEWIESHHEYSLT
ncbi:hypothetical protein FUA26_12905 [Seonamhaeicola algicola]|uniref:STAS/SEC14 domain-containing protein n=1 Tax=Seonamhaeicola algicola TaxID=1719036 RepID=A0A5C7AEU3_9FLAO|nr:hypothetical protein [Seonamhaeicola algicola]TXE07118.1 hypothetical protein FUA26_12905 [Seonamhaeicola algicola]